MGTFIFCGEIRKILVLFCRKSALSKAVILVVCLTLTSQLGFETSVTLKKKHNGAQLHILLHTILVKLIFTCNCVLPRHFISVGTNVPPPDRVAQLVEPLPLDCEVLTLIPSRVLRLYKIDTNYYFTWHSGLGRRARTGCIHFNIM